MKVWIPTIGDKIRLLEPWTCFLKPDYRNSEMHALAEDNRCFTFPAGTVLKVERIYIRSGYRQFDSVTFRTFASPDLRLAPKKQGGNGKSYRFFATLRDVNKIEAEPFDEPS